MVDYCVFCLGYLWLFQGLSVWRRKWILSFSNPFKVFVDQVTFHFIFRCSFTHYDTLKLNRNATPKDIKNAYLKLSKEVKSCVFYKQNCIRCTSWNLSLQYHPDRNPNDPHSHDRFVKLQEAYQTLGNADAKRNYDATLGFGSGSKTKSGFNRPYGHPDYTQRDEWIRADQRR